MSDRRTILVIEDDRAIRETLCEALDLEGYRVLSASNGKEALHILASSEKPGLIFLDVMMPIMNGHEFLDALKADMALAPIPVIVVSATDSGKVNGAHGFIKKPVDLDIVLKIAESHYKP